MRSILLIAVFLGAYFQSLSQEVDTNAIKKFFNDHAPFEEQFISALKNQDSGKCLKLITTEAQADFGKPFLLSELNSLGNYYKKYPDPTVSHDFGLSSTTVGTFGHDVTGTLELKSRYDFRDKEGRSIYYFSIYYTNGEPIGMIKTIETDSSINILLRSYK